MNSLETVICQLQAEILAYNAKPTKVQATKLRKSLMNIQKESSLRRKSILAETKSKVKKIKEMDIPEPPMEAIEPSIIEPLIQHSKTKKRVSKV